MTQIRPKRILLVEDEILWQQGIQQLLTLAGPHQYILAGVATNYHDGLKMFESVSESEAGFTQALDWVLLDWNLSGEPDGLALGKTLEAKGFPPERIILISGSDASVIPDHPYRFVPKARIATELLPTLANVRRAEA